MTRVAWAALALAFFFGLVFWFDWFLAWGFFTYHDSANSAFTPFYYSIATYTTLGFGDVTPGHWMGEVIISLEVIAGYLTLGLLVSILANKVARRA